MPGRLRLVTLLGIILVAVLSFGISAGAQSDGAEDEVGAAQQRLAELRMEAGSAYEAHDNAVFQLNELDEEIVSVSRDLGTAEGDLAQAQGRLEERAAQMYKSGNVGFVDVLVGAEDFSDFANRVDLWMRLLARERAEFEKVREARDEIAQRKAELEATRDRRSAAVGEADAQIDRATRLEAEAQAYLDGLNAELREAMEAEQAAAAERARKRGEEIRAEIAKAEPEAVEEVRAPEPVPAAEPAPEPVEESAEEPAQEAPVVRNLAARQAAADRAAERAAAERYAAEKAAAAKEARLAAERAEAAEQARLQKEAERAQRRAELAEERAAAQAAAEEAAKRQARRQAAAEAAAEEQAAAEQQYAQRPGGPSADGGAGQNQYDRPNAGDEQYPGGNTGGGRPGGGGRPSAGAGGGTASGGAVVSEASRYMGTPYVFGGPADCVPFEAMDCSCLTMTAYQAFGISLPDSPAAQYGYGTPVTGPPMAGDLVFFNENGSGITHVGIATGNGTTVHASAFAGYVTETSIDMVPGYVGARRVL